VVLLIVFVLVVFSSPFECDDAVDDADADDENDLLDDNINEDDDDDDDNEEDGDDVKNVLMTTARPRV
jgi:hypothetical protein